MKFEQLRPETIRRALEIYISDAYPKGVPETTKIPKLVFDGRSTTEVLQAFVQEEKTQAGQACLHRYVLRVGNERYPFMKLVIHEHLIEGEFVFAVDTHDELDIRPNFPDYEEWQRLKKFNKELREKIENHWREARLDTCAMLRDRMREIPVQASGCGKSRRALVVDDEPELAAAFAELLKTEGFEVEIVHNGREALESVRTHRPHLILTDCEMPVMDGLTLIEKLKEDSATRAIPVILTSARQLTLPEMGRASAFLAKPFSTETMIAYCELVMGKCNKKDDAAATAADFEALES